MRFRYPVKHPRELLRYYLRFLLTPGENGKAPAADELIKGDTCLPNLARILEI